MKWEAAEKKAVKLFGPKAYAAEFARRDVFTIGRRGEDAFQVDANTYGTAFRKAKKLEGIKP